MNPDVSLLGLLATLDDQAPLLPDAQALPWVIRSLWALVMASLCLGLLRRRPWSRQWPPGARAGLTAAVLVLCLLPGMLSPAWWLSLAFQAPSLMSVLLSLTWAVARLPAATLEPASQRQPAGKTSSRWRPGFSRPGPWATAGLLLGWLLLLDLLALTPVSLYAWGFGTPALSAALILLVLAWARAHRPPQRLITAAAPSAWPSTTCMAITLTLFTLTRWPTGNLWDALLDPCLWAILHLRLLKPAPR